MNSTASAKTPKTTREEIERQASEMLKQHGLYTVPVDPVTLANRHGIKIHNAKFATDNVSGMISKKGENINLLVNYQDAPQRKRFTIAHELGHHFLHLLEDGDFVDKDLFRPQEPLGDEMTDKKRQEVQANQFAAALLMPEELVKKAYSITSEIAQLSLLFNVSEPAMAIRLSQLGLV